MAAGKKTIGDLIIKGIGNAGAFMAKGDPRIRASEELARARFEDELSYLYTGTEEEVKQRIMAFYPSGTDDCLKQLRMYWEMLGKKEFYRMVDEKGVRNNIDRYLQEALKIPW